MVTIENILINQNKKRSMPEKEDYFDKDGFLVCGKCNTRKQKDINPPIIIGQRVIRRVPIICKCEHEKIKAEEEYQNNLDFKKKMERLQRDGITDTKYLKFKFENDDGNNKAISEVCMRYVENWQKMKEENMGILFYGGIGTGKTFLACCIANALLQKLVTVSVTNFPRILNTLQSYEYEKENERQKIIDKLQYYSLVVIDDLGVERNTPYSIEQIFNIIDTRGRAKKPLIITTNLSMNELKNPNSLEYKRIYDRVLEMCPIRLKLTGESRRVEIAENKKDKAKRLLGLD